MKKGNLVKVVVGGVFVGIGTFISVSAIMYVFDKAVTKCVNLNKALTARAKNVINGIVR